MEAGEGQPSPFFMFTEHDPLTGLTTKFKVEDGELRIRYEQNNEAVYERLQKLRNAEEYSRDGIKNGMWHAVHITDADCMKMIVEDGFDPYTAPARDLRKFLARNKDKYGHLFATRGNI